MKMIKALSQAGGAIAVSILLGLDYSARAQNIFGNNASYGPDTVERFDAATGVLQQSYTPSGGNGRGVVVVGNVIYSTVVSDSHIYRTDATTGLSAGEY